ncbi:MAG: methionyl-tRNA formyltransferase, partial [Novosphingobium sp.]|uniref:methionyl-tRNA formyltransferase n=1 Tax=Novosphingobium sp. TaxID=1874826 RepID=UPI0032BE71FA
GGRRGKDLTSTPVHKAAEALGIEVRHPVSLKGAEEQAGFAALGADVAVVAAYGLILPQAVLDAPMHGCLNIHASLLPRWRGAAPIQRAILAGDRDTGVTIMQMEAGLDTGPMLAMVKSPVDGKTAGELTAELAEIGAGLMIEVLADLPSHAATVQPEIGVTYAHKIDKSEARIDWQRNSTQVLAQIAAFNPSPGAYFQIGDERIRVHSAVPLLGSLGTASPQLAFDAGEPGHVFDNQLGITCGSGAIRPETVQRAGRSLMTVQELLRGFPIPKGSLLA